MIYVRAYRLPLDGQRPKHLNNHLGLMISLPHDQQCMFTPTPSVSVPFDTEIAYGAL